MEERENQTRNEGIVNSKVAKNTSKGANEGIGTREKIKNEKKRKGARRNVGDCELDKYENCGKGQEQRKERAA